MLLPSGSGSAQTPSAPRTAATPSASSSDLPIRSGDGSSPGTANATPSIAVSKGRLNAPVIGRDGSAPISSKLSRIDRTMSSAWPANPIAAAKSRRNFEASSRDAKRAIADGFADGAFVAGSAAAAKVAAARTNDDAAARQ